MSFLVDSVFYVRLVVSFGELGWRGRSFASGLIVDTRFFGVQRTKMMNIRVFIIICYRFAVARFAVAVLTS